MTVWTKAVPIPCCGALRLPVCPGSRPVFGRLWRADEAPAAAVGDVAEFLDVHVEHRAGVGVFVAADRFAGVRGPGGTSRLQPAAAQYGVDGRGGHAELVGDARPGRGVCGGAGCTIRRTTRRGVRFAVGGAGG